MHKISYKIKNTNERKIVIEFKGEGCIEWTELPRLCAFENSSKTKQIIDKRNFLPISTLRTHTHILIQE